MKMRMLSAFSVLALAISLPATARGGTLECTMRFDLSSWSVIYKHASGEGDIHCNDGSHMKVALRANGGGLTVGKNTIKGGVGNFSDIGSIDETLGTYVAAEASAGVPKAGEAQVMTKGNASLALAGAGKGFGLGVSIGGLTISRHP